MSEARLPEEHPVHLEARPDHPLLDPARARVLLESFSGASMSMVFGVLSLGSLGAVWVAWPSPGRALAPATLMLCLAASTVPWRRAALAGDVRRFDLWSAPVAILEIAWVHALVLAVPEAWPLVRASVLALFILGWVAVDAALFFDSWLVRTYYFLGFLAVPVGMLLLDLLTGKGLLHAISERPSEVWQLLGVDLLLLLLTQALIAGLGRLYREAHAARQELQLVEVERTRVAVERASFARAGRMLADALEARRFRHDVGNRVAVMALSLDVIDDLSARDGDPDEVDTLRGLSQAIRDVSELMHAFRARSVEGVLRPSSDVLPEVLRSFEIGSAAHGALTLPSHDVEEAVWFVGPDHGAALASILINGALRSGARPVELVGRRVSPVHYLIQVRDFGVEGAERVAAVDRVRAGLALQEVGTRRDGRFHGLGIGLSLCQLQFAQFGGWVAVHPATDGPGLVLSLAVSMVPDDARPLSEPGPEAWAARAAPLRPGRALAD